MSERLSRERIEEIRVCANTRKCPLGPPCPVPAEHCDAPTMLQDALAHIAALEAENERLNRLSIDLRACMFEARHKWGLEQDKNDKLWAVAEAARKVSSYTRTEPVDDIVNVLDALDDALVALDGEVGE